MTRTSSRSSRALSMCALMLVCMAVIPMPARAQDSVPMLDDPAVWSRCDFSTSWERGRWRLIRSADYQGESWDAWRKQTGQSHPGRAVGDFDGDGVPDVATVVVRDDGAWMLGVVFGQAGKSGACKTHQISQNRPEHANQWPAVLTFAKAASSVKCHHAGLVYHAACSVAADEAPQMVHRRPYDAIVSTNESATSFSGYLWQQWDSSTRADGSPLMVMGELPLKAEVLPPQR